MFPDGHNRLKSRLMRSVILTLIMFVLLSCDKSNNSDSTKTPILKFDGFTYLHTHTYSCGGQRHTVQEYRHNKTGLEFVLLPGNNKIKPFLMGKYELTQEIWQQVMGNNPSRFQGEYTKFKTKDKPVEQITWCDCQEFCKKTGLSLPSEAQWEYACRSGTSTDYYWGDGNISDYCWWTVNSSSEPHSVGQKKPNAFGLHDMSGNVYEWCQSKWEKNKPYRVVRGGSFFGNSPAYLCSSYRAGSDPSDHQDILGVRVCFLLGQN